MASLFQIKRILRQSRPGYLTPSAKADKDSLSQKIGLAILVAALSFLGATAGTFITSRMETARWAAPNELIVNF